MYILPANNQECKCAEGEGSHTAAAEAAAATSPDHHQRRAVAFFRVQIEFITAVHIRTSGKRAQQTHENLQLNYKSGSMKCV